MRGKNFQGHPSERAGTIRRVIRRGYQFICGLCREIYLDPRQAQGCLSQCWQELLRLPPVIQRTKGNLKRPFRCRFCARDHQSLKCANACANDCLSAARQRYEMERKELPLIETKPLKLRRKGPRAVPSLRVQPPPLKRKPHEASRQDDGPAFDVTINVDAGREPAAPMDVTPEAQLQEGATQTEPSQQGAVPLPQAEGDKTKPKDKFYRDAAKYACTVCNERYFTRVEVEQCYDSH